LSSPRLSLLHNLIPSISVDSDKVCNVCPLAKQKHLSFPISNKVSKFPFDLVHIDIWGLFSQQSTNGSHYFLTIVDDFSRYTWVHLMAQKSQTRLLIQSFFKVVATQFNFKIKVLRSDNGVEFHMNEFLSSQGTLHQHSCVETPQQNSIVDRKHQHLLNVVRALKFQSNLPLSFWGDCVFTATHLTNRIPSPLLSNKSPYELLFSTLPTYSHLKVFGCLAFASTLSYNRTKFDPKAVPCVFLGYPNGMKGYKLLNIHINSMFISRNVVFHESIFPFASKDFHHDSNGNFFKPHELLHNSIQILESYSNDDHTMFSQETPHEIDSVTPHEVPHESNSIISHDNSHESDSINLYDHHSKQQLNSRKSTRIKKVLGYLKQYHCQLASFSDSTPYTSINKVFDDSIIVSNASIPFSLSSVLNYDNLSPSHKAFSLSLISQTETQFFHQVVKSPEWRDAMQSELNALEANNTWVSTKLPAGKKAIRYKWVYKIKLKSDGSIERHKARLVVKGYTQYEGLDYHETFSPVAKLTTVRCLQAIAASKNWFLHQLDVNNAFLYGDLDEKVCMSIPPGFGIKGESQVCKL
jgi:hypothetical protein